MASWRCAICAARANIAIARDPDLVLLDLANLPGKDGREVLGEMKADPQLQRIPVVIMTTADAEADVLKSYDLYANCYIVKPVNLAQFVRVVRSIEDFWLSIVKLPSRLDAKYTTVDDALPRSCLRSKTIRATPGW